MELSVYDRQMVRITDRQGRMFTGRADVYPSGFGLHEFGREEESIRISVYQIFESDAARIETLPDLRVLRAAETWQQAGAYYVRIQAMARKHHISLRQEFDEHDRPDTRYIVVTDRDFPVSTARMYPLDGSSVMIGRVVVLPEYRRQGIGSMTVLECEQWAAELGFTRAVLESRDNKTAFYEQLGYEISGEPVQGDTFRCIRMEKDIG